MLSGILKSYGGFEFYPTKEIIGKTCGFPSQPLYSNFKFQKRNVVSHDTFLSPSNHSIGIQAANILKFFFQTGIEQDAEKSYNKNIYRGKICI